MKNRLKSRDIAPGVRVTSTDEEWVKEYLGETQDPLAPASGILLGLAISIPFWLAIIALIVWWYHG